MPTYVYPTSVELETIEQVKLPKLTQNSPIFKLFPFNGKRSHILQWEQMDNFIGLQQVRGLNGMPPKVARVGIKAYMMKPGVYGEHISLDEEELTIRRAMGTFGTPINIADLVMQAQNQLLQRRLDRQEWLGWQLVTNGFFMVLDLKGTLVHGDSYTQQQYTSAVAWGTPATSTPLADFRAVQLLSRGQSVSFGANATAYMNRTTANQLLVNTNANDLGGRRLNGLTPANSMNAINTILAGEGLPQIEVYDEGYIDDANTFQLFIPNNVVILVGRRTNGAALGEFRYTLNVNNPDGAPKPYTRVIDRVQEQIPREIEVHDGFNGGLVLQFPGSLVKMNV